MRFVLSRVQLRRCLALAVSSLLYGLGTAHAVTVNIAYLEGSQPVAPDAVTTLGPELFGDKLNLFNGALEFEQIDTQLPGNNALRVAVTRRYSVGRSLDVRGQFGDWDLETPRIGGSFAAGWVTSSRGLNRCSGFSLPPQVSSSSGGGFSGYQKLTPQTTRNASPATPGEALGGSSTQAVGTVGFLASDYWQGTNISIPGHGSQEVLRKDLAYTLKPADGRDYALVTRGNWQLDCLPSVQNDTGEGFTAVTPDGVRYRFDWMATRFQTSVKKSGAEIERMDHFLMATEVTDRFGNWVRYSYEPASPLLLRRIESSDGRVIVVTNAGGRAVSVNDGTRTFTYSYDGLGNLKTVLQPDGSRWTFNLGGMTAVYMGDMGEGANCDRPGTLPPDELDGTMTHPSGAIGTFRTRYVYLGRTYVDRYCKFAPRSNTYTTGAVYPQLFGSQALVEKAITGPGMADMRWAYQYSANYGWNPCTGCSDRRVVMVTKPGGGFTAYQFGNRWRVNEGQLLRVDEGWTGAAWLKTTRYRYRTAEGQRFPDQFGASLLRNSDYLATKNRPQDQRVITQQGATFTWETNTTPDGFDELARPVKASQFSSLNPALIRTQATEYHDNQTLWVLGQRKRLVELPNNRELERHAYHGATALKQSSHHFGLLTNSFAYRQDGTLETLYDAANRPIAFQNFMRGKPQRAVFADGSVASRVVNNLGQVVTDTNEAGTTTSYTFDAMGRVATITPPVGDAAAYTSTAQMFVQVQSDAYGLGPGHWRQYIVTGTGYRFRYFDALWRVRVEERFDMNSVDTTRSYVETRYDAENRKSFVSYPSRTFTVVDRAIAGQKTSYDGLDRVTRQDADSELGVLSTTTEYLTGLQRRVTNPRGFSTTHAFQAFDNPDDAHLAGATMADGSWLTIARDLYSKPTTISRGGLYGGAAQQATRAYVYDEYHRLCKTVEPETGATIKQYDTAGNMAWRASGLNLPGSATCDQGSVPPSRMVAFTYDARDRLKDTSYGDGSPGVARTYTPDGLLATIVSGASSWAYTYNNRRLLTGEALYTPYVAGAAVAVGYGYDHYGTARYLVYGDGTTIDRGNNALGQPTQVGSHATGVTYHPNGVVAGYRLGNGRTHSTELNLRGLPSVRRDDTLLWDAYTYDANGNVTGISDWQEGISSRVMGYDAMDRLTAANGVWGNGTFVYDALDNLRSSVVGSRSLTHQYADGTNRLTGLAGSQNLAMGYDANGNITQRGSQGFVFDIGNRIQQATGVASYAYDGHGRRFWVQNTDGSWKFQFYSLSGKLLLTRHSSQGETKHLYLGNGLLAEVNSVTGVSYSHTDLLGSPVAKSDAAGGLLQRTRYEPYGGTAAGTNPVGIGFTGHVNDGETGLVYMQQRYYDPIAGRFLSVDPVTTNAKDGSFFGRYHYTNNNPYKFVDPDGRAGALAACAAGPVGCAVGVAVTIAVGAKALSDTAKIVQSTSSNSSNSGSGQQGGDKAPSVPDKLVGTVDDKSGQQGGRVNNGPLAPDNGGTGDAAKDFGKLTGGKIGESGKYPGVRGENGIGMRPGKEGEGPRIDIPANGNKPAETLHYPKPEPK